MSPKSVLVIAGVWVGHAFSRTQRGGVSSDRAVDVRSLGEGPPLLGRRMPDLDLVTANGPLRVFTLLHDARPVLLNLGEPGGFDITRWADRVHLVDAKYVGRWELPALGPVTAPTAVLIRPDGYVAWVGDLTQLGLADALTTWFGPPCGVAHRLPKSFCEEFLGDTSSVGTAAKKNLDAVSSFTFDMSSILDSEDFDGRHW